MSDWLYKRVLSVRIQTPNGDYKIFEHNVDEGKLFRIDFEVDFKGNSTVSLFNVLDSTVNMSRPAKVQNGSRFPVLSLEAGYDKNISQLANGEIIQSVLKRTGPDRILEMKIVPKASLLTEYVIPKEYNGTLQTILKEVLEDNGITYYEILNLSGLDALYYGFTVTGTLAETLTRICKMMKSSWSFYLGKLVIGTDDDKTYLKNQKVILDKDSGLIGTPAVKGAGYSVKSLLMPRIAGNQVVHLTFNDPTDSTKTVDREFISKSGKHKGSSWTNDYYTEFECIPK